MSNLNRIVLVGTVNGKPEMRFSAESSLSISKFTMAVARPPRQDGQIEYDTIPVVAFGRTADSTAEIPANSVVVVEGKIQTNQTETGGVKQWITEVNANLVRTISAGQNVVQPVQTMQSAQITPQPQTGGNPFETTEDDVPF